MRTATLLAVSALCACVPQLRGASELGAVPAYAARVCVVRPEATDASTTMKVLDNGRLVGATRGRTYTCWLAMPGAHQITADADDTGPTYLDVQPGARHFLHLEVTAIIGGDTHAHLDTVDERTANDLIDACDTRVIVSVPGHDDTTGAMPIAPSRTSL